MQDRLANDYFTETNHTPKKPRESAGSVGDWAAILRTHIFIIQLKFYLVTPRSPARDSLTKGRQKQKIWNFFYKGSIFEKIKSRKKTKHMNRFNG